MKDNIEIPVLKQENQAALTIRRENYAASRDKQAAEFNEAIAKRIAESRHNQTCNTCGKEFTTGKADLNTLSCPACSETTTAQEELTD